MPADASSCPSDPNAHAGDDVPQLYALSLCNPDGPGGPYVADVDVSVEDDRWTEALPDLAGILERACRGALDGGHAGDLGSTLEFSVVLTDDEAVRALNRDYRGRDCPTNVLSFASLDDTGSAPLPEGMPLHLGDIVVAFDTTLAEAQERPVPLADHLFHLAVHGILHLLGFDHEDDDEATEMEALEADILVSSGLSNPYHTAGEIPEEDAK
ncbi:rRNA maturation RNase YbeY [Phaeovibrio sulfidiphilus]|nr:rRNA maturation RNase YbeY [Phaeovibrio sulfidiphilus]